MHPEVWVFLTPSMIQRGSLSSQVLQYHSRKVLRLVLRSHLTVITLMFNFQPKQFLASKTPITTELNDRVLVLHIPSETSLGENRISSEFWQSSGHYRKCLKVAGSLRIFEVKEIARNRPKYKCGLLADVHEKMLVSTV